MEEEMSSKHAKNMGKIVDENGEYFLELGSDSRAHLKVGSASRAQKYPLGPIVESTMPKEIVGKNVELVLSSDPRPSVVGIKFSKKGFCYFILCYFPVDILGSVDYGKVIPLVDKDVRTMIAQKLLDGNVITAEDHGRIVNL
jgi:hypothetical protein